MRIQRHHVKYILFDLDGYRPLRRPKSKHCQEYWSNHVWISILRTKPWVHRHPIKGLLVYPHPWSLFPEPLSCNSLIFQLHSFLAFGRRWLFNHWLLYFFRHSLKMAFSKIVSLTGLLASASMVAGHGYVSGVVANGK